MLDAGLGAWDSDTLYSVDGIPEAIMVGDPEASLELVDGIPEATLLGGLRMSLCW